ncbi:MAG: NADH-quinone oxidoreductase subunit D [Thermodesulfobacteriota bacterium]|nr:NADH-quinone oxidoreductase subunit D [Thermodesulfobacteriota bacterium]
MNETATLDIPVSQGDEDRYRLKLGPQHPATHGVLRVDLELDGETILDCDPQVGYLHRGFEKLAEHRTYAQNLVLTDRLDYIAAMANNVGYCEAVEKLLAIEVPERAKFLRVMVCEMSRLTGHLLWLATHALDIGAMTVFLYCFREREVLLELFAELCGARLTTTYTRLGGVRQDVTHEIMMKLDTFVDDFPACIEEYETLIDTNRIWLKRTIGVGQISGEKAVDLCLTGASLRGSGVDYDIRKHMPYAAYDQMDFEIPLGETGDTYARYRCRMEEMRQSNYILRQCIEKMPPGPIVCDDAPDLVMPVKPGRKVEVDTSARNGLIKLIEDRDVYMEGDIYVATEVPKGELGFYFISDGMGRPYRMHIRSPSFIHIGALATMGKGVMVADLIAIIGTLDVVLGECDR